jgi:hypothetical protein
MINICERKFVSHIIHLLIMEIGLYSLEVGDVKPTPRLYKPGVFDAKDSHLE